MLQAPRGPIITRPIRLSSLFADPMIRDAFLRAERNHGDAFAVPAKQPAIAPDGVPTRDPRDALVPPPLRQRIDLPAAIVVLLFITSLMALVLSALLPSQWP
jgi:hypothetical protein